MVKKFTPPPRAKLIRSSIRLPTGMKDALEQAMLNQDWSLKRRSSWIATACEALLDNPDHEDLIREEFYDGKTVTLPLAMDSELVAQLNTVAERMTSVERIVDRSSVIRTAITQAVLAAAGRQINLPVPLGDTR
jgi:metal-responsive CopG/Arc/MetJ family transcriptional regulator